MTINQFEKQFETWRKSGEKDIYEDIKKLAQVSGVLTKRGKITRRNTKKAEKMRKEFFRQYQQKFGSYTRFKTKQKERYRQSYMDKTSEKWFGSFKKFQEYERQTRKGKGEYSQLIERLFEKILPSSLARNYFDYAEMMDEEQAIEFLKNVLDENNDEIGDDEDEEPPFS